MNSRDTRWVALLRGINVGTAKRVAMADLRVLVEALGYRDVKTLLNSGNVVFTGASAKPATVAMRIEGALLERTGVAARVVALTGRELVDALDANPLGAPPDPARFLVATFLDEASASRVRPLLDRDWTPDRIDLAGRIAWLSCDTGLLESPLVKAFGRAAGETVTTRNWTTMMKLRAMAE